MWWLIVGVAGAVECADAIQQVELEEALSSAEKAYVELEDVTFRDKVNELAGLLLPCVKESLPAPLAARYHRLMALHLNGTGDPSGAQGALRAARDADPVYVFTDEFLPPQHELRAYYDGLPAEDGRRKTVPEPRAGSLSFDGEHGRKRPADHPAIVQLVDAGGMAYQTVYLGEKEPLPKYVAIPRQRNALIVCSGSALALSVGSFVVAALSKGALLDQAQDQSVTAAELDAIRGRANGFTVGSGVLFGGAVGCGTAAALVGPR